MSLRDSEAVEALRLRASSVPTARSSKIPSGLPYAEVSRHPNPFVRVPSRRTKNN